MEHRLRQKVLDAAARESYALRPPGRARKAVRKEKRVTLQQREHLRALANWRKKVKKGVVPFVD